MVKPRRYDVDFVAEVFCFGCAMFRECWLWVSETLCSGEAEFGSKYVILATCAFLMDFQIFDLLNFPSLLFVGLLGRRSTPIISTSTPKALAGKSRAVEEK